MLLAITAQMHFPACWQCKSSQRCFVPYFQSTVKSFVWKHNHLWDDVTQKNCGRTARKKDRHHNAPLDSVETKGCIRLTGRFVASTEKICSRWIDYVRSVKSPWPKQTRKRETSLDAIVYHAERTHFRDTGDRLLQQTSPNTVLYFCSRKEKRAHQTLLSCTWRNALRLQTTPRDNHHIHISLRCRATFSSVLFSIRQNASFWVTAPSRTRKTQSLFKAQEYLHNLEHARY